MWGGHGHGNNISIPLRQGVGPGTHLHGNSQAHILERECHYLEDLYWPGIPSLTSLTPSSRKPSRILPTLTPTPAPLHPTWLLPWIPDFGRGGGSHEGEVGVGVSESSWEREIIIINTQQVLIKDPLVGTALAPGT